MVSHLDLEGWRAAEPQTSLLNTGLEPVSSSMANTNNFDFSLSHCPAEHRQTEL